MATEHAAPGEAAPVPTNSEALMADRQMFWGQFCRTAFWAVVVIGGILVMMDLTLL
jgi:hypothetical protein